MPQTTISEEERDRRQAAIDFARGSVRFEGYILDDTLEALSARFVQGEFTPDEFMEEIRAYVRVKPLDDTGTTSRQPGIKED
ncbi:MAG TPA: antitoxin VbhA family protein [Rhodocyclaceae bacterium]|nr:antitoxin VbhA family protein [Rhodocyclaceae bacterium]